MTAKNKIYYTVFIGLLVTSIAVHTIQYRNIESLHSDLTLCRENEGREIAKNFDLQQALPTLFKNDHHKIDETIKVKSEQGDSITLSSLSKRGTVIYRFFSTSCFSCIMEMATLANKIDSLYPGKSIVFISDIKEDEQMKKMKDILNIHQQVYRTESLGLPIEQAKIPYLFILTTDNEVRLPYTPQLQTPELTHLYFSTINF